MAEFTELSGVILQARTNLGKNVVRRGVVIAARQGFPNDFGLHSQGNRLLPAQLLKGNELTAVLHGNYNIAPSGNYCQFCGKC